MPQITVSVSDDVLEEIDQMAEADDRSRSSIVRRILDAGLSAQLEAQRG